ncbi:MAG: RsmE family RNA methyltransferase [Myxococcota bacterium]
MARDRPHSLRRIYVPTIPAEGSALLDEDARHHLEVLRLAPGTEIELFDGKGTVARATLEGSTAHVLERSVRDEATIVLVLGLPKGSLTDEIVRMTTELGVSRLCLTRCERTVPKWDDSRGAKRLARWTRIAQQAARQSERAFVPAIEAPRPLHELIDNAPADATRLFAWARESSRAAVRVTSPCWIAVGPEGGFSDAERTHFENAGWLSISLGPNVLRVDTAAAAAIALTHRSLESQKA